MSIVDIFILNIIIIASIIPIFIILKIAEELQQADDWFQDW